MDNSIQSPEIEIEDELTTIISAVDKFMQLPPEGRILVLEKLREIKSK